MSWMNMLYQTYENNKAVAGKTNESVSLSVIAHMPANSQLEVTIDEKGEFVSVKKVDKKEPKILIPVTEASASRGSGIAPHALNDTLSYIAGDFYEYVKDEKEKEASKRKFEAYIKSLQKWKEAEFSHEKVSAIYQYLSKQSMMKDLIDCKIVKIDENGVFAEEKINGKPYDKVMVRFVVRSIVARSVDRTWEDESLMEAYTKFYLSTQNGERNICFITGEEEVITNNHPKGIIQSSYGAKLVSGNDKENFTYRGRFIEAEDACTISYEASQKAHSALTWLAAKQGVTIGTKDKRTYICWNPKGKETPEIDSELEFENEEKIAYTQEEYKKKLYRAVQGYKEKLDDNDDIVIIGLDAATTGRLSVIYYNELKASDFLSRLKNWKETCNWYFTKFTPEKKPYYEVETPSVERIVKYTFGTERGQYIEVNDKILKEQVQRIYYCILDGMPLPKDIVYTITMRASNPMIYSNSNYEKLLSTACALIKKDKGGNISMVLDTENTDRSYLFGRLLAVAEVAEKIASGKEVTRPTNATRLQTAFVNRPFFTWSNIKSALSPYMQKLNRGSREYYENLMEEIVCMFQEEDMDKLNKGLEPTYLLGYYAQRKELRTKKETVENKEEKI